MIDLQTMNAEEINNMDSTTFFNAVSDFKPITTIEDIKQAECMQEDHINHQRIILATLTKIFKAVEQDTEGMEALFNVVNEHITSLQEFIKLSRCASTRLLIALSESQSCDQFQNTFQRA